MNALNTQDESFQLGMYASEIQNQEQLQMQSEVFDQMMDERSENMREVDTLAQRRHGAAQDGRLHHEEVHPVDHRMMNGPILPLRTERTTAPRGSPAAPRGAAAQAAEPPRIAEQQAQIAAQRQAFDYEDAERAEIVREHEVLEALLMAHLKNEDEITKKWIALI